MRLPFRIDGYKKKVVLDEQHYSLAFQGGGAKGLAYVGAYKSLR